MKTLQKAAVAVASTGLVLSGIAISGVGAADAATSCAAQNAAANAALTREIAAVNHATQAATRLLKAKKANRKHHTKATKRRLRKARKAKRTADAAVQTAYAAYRVAESRAAGCHGTTSSSGGGTTSTGTSGSTGTNGSGGVTGASGSLTPFVTEINGVLGGLGLSTDAVNGLAAQLSDLLGGSATQTKIDDALNQLKPVLTALQDGGAGLPLNTATLTSALSNLSSSGLSGTAVGDVLGPITSTLVNGGLNPAELQTVLGGLLGQLGAGSLGTDPSTFAQNAVTVVEGLLPGLNDSTLDLNGIAAALNNLVPSLTSTLTGLLASLGLGSGGSLVSSLLDGLGG